jgi:bifunctional non-homologous end joining protein LigD
LRLYHGGVPRTKKSGGPAFTVELPRELPVVRDGEAWWFDDGDGREVRLTNLDKVFWPDEGYTKGDLLAYYYNVADLILPYLAGRPLTMKRMPNGVSGHFFYEKNQPPNTPEWMRICPVEGEDDRGRPKTIEYLLCDDVAGLLFMVNLGCIEFHPLHSRCDSYEFPDYAFFDLDPMEVGFDMVLVVARHVKAALDALGLAGYIKTSGATGAQIYVPIEPRFTHDEVREFVRLVGVLIKKADPDRVTMTWEIRRRTGKVFIDHNMNRSGANIAAAYCMRPEPGATVSTPLAWEEVEEGVSPGDFRIDNVWERFARVGDLFRPVTSEPQDLDVPMRALGVDLSKAPPLPGVIQRDRRTRSRVENPPPPPEAAAPKRKAATRSAAPTGAPAEEKPAQKRRGAGRETSDEVIARSRDPKLGEYLRKRDLSATPEPGPSGNEGRGDSFVIQKHRATRLHYDTRLERDGVLVSWAVPKGLPVRKGEKKLAVMTEDHPLEYGSFEGLIPKGHYGAGPVRIFDSGTYDLIEWEDGRKVTFRLHGNRYRGAEFHLVKTRTDWLVFLSRPEEVEVGRQGPPFTPMLAKGGYQPFDDPRWRFEPKLDGVRTLLYVDMESTRLVSRRGRDQTAQYPELATAHEYVTSATAVLDGEIVAMKDGRPSFEQLQQRMNLASSADIERARKTIPVECYLFDILWFDGRDVTSLPLEERRELLESLIVPGHRLTPTLYVDGEGVPLAQAARERGFEGVMAKRLGSRYLPGRRNGDWRKIKLLNRQDCVVLGWTPGTGARSKTFGALLVGAYDEGELRWIGQVGTGFTDRMLADLMRELEPLRCQKPMADDPELRKVKGACFVEPKLVCEVEFLEMTSAGKLRAPSYKGLRHDKEPEDCILERPKPAPPTRRRRSG